MAGRLPYLTIAQAMKRFNVAESSVRAWVEKGKLQRYSLTDTRPPWDTIHYETVDRLPPGVRSVSHGLRVAG